MKRILIPTDYSSTAENAVKIALQIAKREDANIYLVHVAPFNFSTVLELNKEQLDNPLDSEVMEIFMNKELLKMNDYLKGLKTYVKIEKIVEIGVPNEVINSKIKELNIDLVVMGTHGASGLREYFIGSNAEKVVRYATCPVLTVKHEISLEETKHIIFGTDLLDVNENVIQPLKQLQDIFRAELTIIRVNTPNTFQKDGVIKVLKDKLFQRYLFNNTTFESYNDFSVEAGLRNAATDKGASIIALATHGRKGLSHLIAGSLAEDLTNHTTKAIWTNHLKI
jgi:nucleotide-binding universal stress UspA family protein